MPLINPVLLFRLNPAGKPVTLYVNAPLTSLAVTASDTLPPSVLLWLVMLLTLTYGLTVQRNCCWLIPVASLAVTVTAYGPFAAAPAAITPEINPALGSRLRPAGRALLL